MPKGIYNRKKARNKTYACKQCGKSFNRPVDVARHTRIEHPKEVLVHVDWDGPAFPQSNSVIMYMTAIDNSLAQLKQDIEALRRIIGIA